MSDPRKETEFELPDLQVPDLELEPVPAKASTPARAANAATQPRSSSAAASVSSGLPELDLEAGAAVVLGASTTADANYFGVANFGGDFEDGMLEGGASLAVATDGYDRSNLPASAAPGTEPAWPSGRTPAADQIDVDPREVDRVAGFGAAPAAFYAAPAYAYRVAARQRVLRKALLEADAELRAAEGERDLRVAELTLSLRSKLEQDERFRRLFEPLAALDRAASDQDQALSLVSSEYEAQASELHAELEAVKTDLLQRGLVEQAASKAFLDREANWKRADAKLKRTNIEIRNLIESNRGAPGQPAPPLPPAKARELAQLNERLSAQKDEATTARAEHDRAQAELSNVRQQVGELHKRARRIEQQQTALAQKYQRRFDRGNKGLSEAESQRISLLAEIGRAVLHGRSTLPIPPQTLAAIAEADRVTLEQSRKAAALLRALDAYDRHAVKQGRTIAAVLAGAAMALIVLKFAL